MSLFVKLHMEDRGILGNDRERQIYEDSVLKSLSFLKNEGYISESKSQELTDEFLDAILPFQLKRKSA